MAKAKKKTAKKTKADIGKQQNLIDVQPENAKAIIAAAHVYKQFQLVRLRALEKETAQKQVVLTLIKEAKLQPIDGGIIKFTWYGVTISVTPRDELIKIKEESPDQHKGKDATANGSQLPI